MRLIFHKPYPVAKLVDLADVPPELLRDNGKNCKANKNAFESMMKLCEKASSEKVQILVLSAYRSFEEQVRMFQKAEEKHGKGKGAIWVAPPGFSEHHTGYVFDLADANFPETDDESSFETTPAFEWLLKNAEKFYFELSFPKGNWQGVGYEPWHWRFIGDGESSKLFHPPFLKMVSVLLKSLLNGLRRCIFSH